MSEPRETRPAPPSAPKPPRKPKRPPVAPSVTPQAPNHTPIPSAPASEIVASQPHTVAPYRKVDPIHASVSKSLGLGVSKPRPRPKSYLETHPLIRQQLVDAQKTMDPFNFSALLTDTLEGKYNFETEQLKKRLARKEMRVRDYFTDADIAEKAGDLDYTEDNPINPRLLSFPDLHGGKSQSGLRRELHQALLEADSPAEVEAIHKFYEGDIYNPGLLDFGEYRQRALNYQATALKKATSFHEQGLAKNTAYHNREVEKFLDYAKDRDMSEEEIKEGLKEFADPSEPMINFFSLDPNENPMMPGRTRWETKVMRNRMVSLQHRVLRRRYKEAIAKPPTTMKGSVEISRPAQGIIGADSASAQQLADSQWNPAAMNEGGPESVSAYEKYIGKPVGLSLMYALDKASRPIYGVNATLDFVYSKDADPENTTQNTLLGRLTGKDIGNATEDMSLSDVLEAAKAGWKGFSSGGIGNSDNPVLGQEIIKHNAEADPSSNIYDHGWYQAVAGFAGDVAFDPLSYLTFGAAKVGARGALGAVRKSKNIDEFAEGSPKVDRMVRDFFEDAGIADTIDARAARDLISGKVSAEGFRLPTTSAEKAAHVRRVGRTLANLEDDMRRTWAHRNATGEEQRQVLQRKAAEYEARREEVLNDAGMKEVQSILENHVAQQVQEGKLPASALDRYSPETLLRSADLSPKMPQISEQIKYWTKVAREMGITKSKMRKSPYGTRDKAELDALIKERDDFARTFGDTPAAKKTLKKYDEDIAKKDAALAEKYHHSQAKDFQETMKGDFVAFMEKHHDLEDKGDVPAINEFMQQMEQAASKVGEKPSGSLRDAIGRDLFDDPRLTRPAIYKALSDARAAAYNSPELKRYNPDVLKGKYATQKAFVENNPGNKEARKALQDIGLRLQATERTFNDAMAAHFVAKIKEHIATSGEGNLNASTRAQGLATLKQQAMSRLNKLNGQDNVYAALDDKDFARNAEGGFDRPTDFLDEMGKTRDEIWEPHPAYYSQRQHYEDILAKADQQLKEENRSFAQQIVEDIDLNNIPETLVKPDGSIDRQALKRAIKLNPATGIWSRIDDLGFPEWNEWADEVAGVLTRNYHDIRGNALRRKNRSLEQVVEREAEDAWDDRITEGLQDLAPMFTSKEGKWLTDKDLAEGLEQGKTLFPYVEIDGKPMLLGKNKTNEKLTELATAADRRESYTNAQVVDELVSGISIKNNAVTKKAKNALNDNQLQIRVDYLVKQLTQAGWHFTDDLEQNIVHIVNNKASALEDLKLHNVVGRRLFEDEHGMSLVDAVDDKQRTLFETARGVGPWGRDHLSGVTQREFVDEALSDFDSFRHMMRGGPFRLELIGKSERTARHLKNATQPLSPESTMGIKLSDEWAKATWEALNKKTWTERVRLMEDIWRSSRSQSRAARATQKKNFKANYIASVKRQDKKLEPGSKRLTLPKEEIYATTRESETETLDALDQAIRTNSLTARGYSASVELKRPMNLASPEKDLLKYAERTMRKDLYAELVAKRAAAKDAVGEELAAIKQGIKDTEQQLRDLAGQYKQFMDKTMKAKALYERELRTEAILRASRIPIARNNRALRVSIMGADHAIPHTDALFRAVEIASGAPLIKQSRWLWNKSFAPPSRGVPEDLVTARARMLGMTPDIIKHDVHALAETFRPILPEVRKRSFDQVRKGNWPKDSTGNAIRQGFEDVMPWFRGERKVDGVPINIPDINKFLRPAFRLNYRLASRMNTPEDLVRAITRGYDEKGKLFKKKDAQLADPYEVLHNLRVAINLAEAEKALHTQINQFGVFRGRGIKNGKEYTIDGYNDSHRVVEDLSKEGWETIEELGSTHYFPPEAVKDIRNLLDMMKPQNSTIVGDTIDQINSIWKAGSTIYNPGYWTRNTIGEVMSSWLAGVNTVTPYKRSFKVMKFLNTEEAGRLDALHSQFPMLKHAELGDQAPKGSDVLFTMPNGEKITVERIGLAYHDQGLNTSFFNTEFGNDLGGLANRANATPGLKQVGQVHRKLRHYGENHEDWLRMAHFIDSVAKSKKPFSNAIQDAAADVRKYHFDYTDFSRMEKMVMVRAFPFYKWTRKAMPLMVGQMFMRPGKMMVYPKAMNTISNQMSTQDFEEDTNGYLPNFTGIAPNWLTNLWAYQVSTENERGGITAFNMSTPQMSGLQSVTNIPGQAYTLANPYAKLLAEQAAGHTFGEEPWAGGNGMDIPLDDKDERIRHLARNLGGPWGNFWGKSYGENDYGYENTVGGQDITAQLTGLGVYDPYLKHPPVGDEKLAKLSARVRAPQ